MARSASTSPRATRSRGIFLLVLLAASCAVEPAPAPTEPDAVPEQTLGGATLAQTWTRDGEELVSPPLAAPSGATRVGVLLSLRPGEARPALEGRGLDGAGRPGPWVPLETTWAEPGQLVARAELGFVASAAQLRVRPAEARSVEALTWSALVPAAAADAPPVEVGRAVLGLRDELADAGVVSRETWGARPSRCAAADAMKARFAIHHTASPSTGDPASRMRGIQAFHMDTRGYCDIGYHFVVSIDGRAWEGRPVEVLGAHVGGHNRNNIGISLLGCFHTSSCNEWTPFVPPDEMVDAAGELVRVLAGVFDIPVSDETLLGHRDHPDQATACPGDHLHARLERIRALGSAPPRPALAAELVARTLPDASAPWELRPGEARGGSFELLNVGSTTWEPGVTFLATTEPRGGESPLAGGSWIGPSRAATLEEPVPPGALGRFALVVHAPERAGAYAQFFNLEHEGLGWFSDPGQGGPPDDALEVRVRVVAEAPAEDAGIGDAGLQDASLGDAGLGDASLGDAGRPTTVTGGCGCEAVGSRRGSLPFVALSALLGLAASRRRGAR